MARFEALVAEEGTMGVIVQRVAEGETLKALAAAWQVPYGRLAQWIVENKDRSELYVNAKALCETARADEIHALADGVKDKLGLGIANLKLKATQWSAAKWNPARFGDSSHVALSVKDDRELDADARLLELARGIGYVFARAADIAAAREPLRQIAAPVDAETVEPSTPPAPTKTDEGVI